MIEGETARKHLPAGSFDKSENTVFADVYYRIGSLS